MAFLVFLYVFRGDTKMFYANYRLKKILPYWNEYLKALNSFSIPFYHDKIYLIYKFLTKSPNNLEVPNMISEKKDTFAEYIEMRSFLLKNDHIDSIKARKNIELMDTEIRLHYHALTKIVEEGLSPIEYKQFDEINNKLNK